MPAGERSRSDASLATVLLTQRFVAGEAESLKASEYWALRASAPDVGALIGRTPGELVASFGLSAELADRVARRLDGGAAAQVVFAVDELEQKGIRVLAAVDDDYPATLTARLGSGAPPLLHVAGDAGLLAGGGLGVLGPSTSDAGGDGRVREIVARVLDEGVAVISGWSEGVERQVSDEVLAAGGHAVGVLAAPLLIAVREPSTRRAITAGRLCLCTPYEPSAAFSAARATGRVKIVDALATTRADGDRGAGEHTVGS